MRAPPSWPRRSATPASRPSTCTATCRSGSASATCTSSPPARPQVVVATDVAARGIHVDNVGLVVHFDPPADAKAYLHRSGPYGAGRRVRRRRLDHHAPPGRRDRPDAVRAGVAARHHDIAHHPPADDPRGARRPPARPPPQARAAPVGAAAATRAAAAAAATSGYRGGTAVATAAAAAAPRGSGGGRRRASVVRRPRRAPRPPGDPRAGHAEAGTPRSGAPVGDAVSERRPVTGRAVVAPLLDVLGADALLVHHQRQDDRQDADHEQDPAERWCRRRSSRSKLTTPGPGSGRPPRGRCRVRCPCCLLGCAATAGAGEGEVPSDLSDTPSRRVNRRPDNSCPDGGGGRHPQGAASPVRRSEGGLVEVHQREVGGLGDGALGGELGQVVLREELRGRDLALVERLVLGRDARRPSLSSATSAPRSSSQAQTTSPSTISSRLVFRPTL